MINYLNLLHTVASSINGIYLLVQPISNGSSSWLIDDTQNVQARDGSSILSGLALRVVEVGGHRNYSIVDSLKGNKDKISIGLHQMCHVFIQSYV